MYRPNRIGVPHNLGDFDKDIVALTAAGVAARVNNSNLFANFVLNAAVLEDYNTDSFQYDADVSLGANLQLGIGNAILGNDSAQDHIYTFKGQLSFNIAAVTNLSIQFIIGRSANAVPLATAGVPVVTPIFLPVKIENPGIGLISASVESLYVQRTMRDGADFQDDKFPIVAFWRLVNDSGSALTMAVMTGRIEIHKYTGDFQTFEPNR